MRTLVLNYFKYHIIVLFLRFIPIFLIFNFQNLFSQNGVTFSQDDKISISTWKYGCNASVNISFDDVYKSHYDISLIFDEYNFKATFYTNYAATTKYYSNYSDMLKRGHEIGNHTLSHRNLTILDSLNIYKEVIEGKWILEKAFKYNCYSFAAPFHKMNDLSFRIVSSSHFFIRDNQFYKQTNHSLLGFMPKSTVNDFQNSFKHAITGGKMLLVTGHGIEKDGWGPIKSSLLKQNLAFLRTQANKNLVWVSTMKDISLYESLRNEVNLIKTVQGDTIILEFMNFDSKKYSSFDSCMLSIDVKTNNGLKYKYITDFTQVRSLEDKDVLTFDLKKVKHILIVRDKSNEESATGLVNVGQNFRYNIILSSNILNKTACSYQANLTYNPEKFIFQSIDYDKSKCFQDLVLINTEGNINLLFPSIFCKTDSQFLVSLTFQVIDSTIIAPKLTEMFLNNESVPFISDKVFKSNYLYGDINGDSKIDSIDSQLILNYCVNRDISPKKDSVIWDPWQIKVANVNKDSYLNSYDSYSILKYKGKNSVLKATNSIWDTDTIKVFLNNDTIYFYSKSPLYSFNLVSNFSFGQNTPIICNEYIMNAVNTSNSSIAFASITPFVDEVFLKIPVDKGIFINYQFSIFQNNRFYTIDKIERNKTIDDISVYPNPSSDIVNFGLPNSIIHLNLKVYNNLGKLLFVSKTNQIDLSNYPKGIYLIHFSDGENVVIKKLIKL